MKGVRESFTRYDSADYLKTEADIAASLEACAKEAPNDPAFMLKALGTVARAQHEPVGRSCRDDPGRVVQGALRRGKPQSRQ